jgi:hypothetical protein
VKTERIREKKKIRERKKEKNVCEKLSGDRQIENQKRRK